MIKKRKNSQEKGKPGKEYRTNKDTVSFNAEQFTAGDPFFPFDSEGKDGIRPISLYKKGSTVCK